MAGLPPYGGFFPPGHPAAAGAWAQAMMVQQQAQLAAQAQAMAQAQAAQAAMATQMRPQHQNNVPTPSGTDFLSSFFFFSEILNIFGAVLCTF